MIITFTPNEAAILLHRLDCHDCILEALEENGRFTEEVLDRVIHRIRYELEQGKYELAYNDQLGFALSSHHMVLMDCCEGSTYFCGIEDAVATGEYSKGNYLADHKAAKSLERKLKCNVCRG